MAPIKDHDASHQRDEFGSHPLREFRGSILAVFAGSLKYAYLDQLMRKDSVIDGHNHFVGDAVLPDMHNGLQ